MKPQLDVPWSHEPIKIPVLGTANVGASDGGEIWLSADSLGRLTSTCAGNSSRHITGSGDTKSGAPVSTIGVVQIDWLLRLPWHVVIMARDKMGWKEIVSDTHLALVTDSDNQEKVRYVVRAKVLDENGVTCPFAISDPDTVLRCSLRIGDKYAVHTNGYLIDLTAESENSSYDGSIQGRRNGGRPMEHSSTDASPAMQTAMQEFLDQAEGGQVQEFSSSNTNGKPEQVFWCSDTARRERMLYEHRKSSEGLGRVDGSIRVWMMSGQESAVKWRFASSNR